jgi:hypothetical protein
MAHQKPSIEGTKGKVCTCCGRRIIQLADHKSLIYFLEESSMQRRGFQCMNCMKVTCYECSNNLRRCACGSNAWVATPYVESVAKETLAHSTA